jgi:hypothetical protein
VERPNAESLARDRVSVAIVTSIREALNELDPAIGTRDDKPRLPFAPLGGRAHRSAYFTARSQLTASSLPTRLVKQCDYPSLELWPL